MQKVEVGLARVDFFHLVEHLTDSVGVGGVVI